jgi:hypothetical protein
MRECLFDGFEGLLPDRFLLQTLCGIASLRETKKKLYLTKMWLRLRKKSHAKPQSREERMMIDPANYADYARILDLRDYPFSNQSPNTKYPAQRRRARLQLSF